MKFIIKLIITVIFLITAVVIAACWTVLGTAILFTLIVRLIVLYMIELVNALFQNRKADERHLNGINVFASTYLSYYLTIFKLPLMPWLKSNETTESGNPLRDELDVLTLNWGLSIVTALLLYFSIGSGIGFWIRTYEPAARFFTGWWWPGATNANSPAESSPAEQTTALPTDTANQGQLRPASDESSNAVQEHTTTDSGITSQADISDVQESAPQKPTTKETEAFNVLNRFIDHLNGHDLAGLRGILSPSITDYEQTKNSTREDILAGIANYWERVRQEKNRIEEGSTAVNDAGNWTRVTYTVSYNATDRNGKEFSARSRCTIWINGANQITNSNRNACNNAHFA